MLRRSRADVRKGFSMKQARCWLSLAVAVLLLPQVAFAQPRKPAAGKPSATQSPPATAPPAAAAGGEIELDDPKPGAGDPTSPAAPPVSDAASGAGGGICEIDPSACPKAADVKALANRPIKADVYAMQQVFFLRRGRFELNPYYSFSLNDQFVGHTGPGIGINYYLTNVLAIGLNGTFYQPFNSDSDFNFQNRRASRLSVPLTEYQAGASLNFTYVPIYGKFQGFSQFIFHYDFFVLGGVGALSTRPIAVIDPDNRKFNWDWKLPTFQVGIGLRIALNRWFTATMSLTDQIFIDRLENTLVAAQQQQQQDSSTWFGKEKPLTNNVQAQIGISVFLPFSWEYRLPK